MELDRIYNEDCLETMRKMPDGIVDLVVTSPPYDNLRQYNGYSFDFESIAKELYRVVKDGGVVVWIVNDATIDGSETGTSFRQALFFKECGFNLQDTMIWCKDGGGAIGSHYAYTQNFEYMFILSKGKPKSVNIIYDKKCLTYSGKEEKSKECRGHSERGTAKLTRLQYSKRNNWWLQVPSKEEGSSFHPAVYPEKLVADHLKSWSNEGDLVYDPFMGSGTTGKMAVILKRRFIGSEISAEYYEKATKRIENEQRQMTLF